MKDDKGNRVCNNINSMYLQVFSSPIGNSCGTEKCQRDKNFHFFTSLILESLKEKKLSYNSMNRKKTLTFLCFNTYVDLFLS